MNRHAAIVLLTVLAFSALIGWDALGPQGTRTTTLVTQQISVDSTAVPDLFTNAGASGVRSVQCCAQPAAANLVRVGSSKTAPVTAAGYALTSVAPCITVEEPTFLLSFIGDAAGPVTVYCIAEKYTAQ